MPCIEPKLPYQHFNNDPHQNRRKSGANGAGKPCNGAPDSAPPGPSCRASALRLTSLLLCLVSLINLTQPDNGATEVVLVDHVPAGHVWDTTGFPAPRQAIQRTQRAGWGLDVLDAILELLEEELDEEQPDDDEGDGDGDGDGDGESEGDGEGSGGDEEPDEQQSEQSLSKEKVIELLNMIEDPDFATELTSQDIDALNEDELILLLLDLLDLLLDYTEEHTINS